MLRSKTTARLLLVTASILLLSGCGDDKPYSGPDPNQAGSSASAPAPEPLAAASPAPAPPSSNDPLVSGSSGIPTADPLLPADKPIQADPLAGSDPLKGPAMPTEHSHWLRGRVQDARLTVLLNGIREGDYDGLVDRDITMKLRRGINTVSFVYTPQDANSSAQMDLLESEHHPPIAPLASFHSLPPAEGTTAETEFKPTTQRFTFFAH